MSEIPRSRTARNAKLASIPLGIAGRAAVGYGRKLVGGDRGAINAELTRRAADQLFNVLGELKGGAMKVGQGLSVLEAAIPDEYAAPFRDALTKLQAEAPAMPIDKVHRVLDQQLGSAWRTRFASFDDTPTAAASIGQVHRAVWSDGRDVAVKVQYPGADEALRADLKTLARMTGLMARVAPGADVDGMMEELNERAEEELDYRVEAENQRAFAKAYHGHPRFVVPRVVASAPKVLVTEWVTATKLSAIIAGGSRAQRDLCAARMAEFHLSSPTLAGLLHGDPHPGNFMLLDDGRFCVIDFGACAPLPDGFPDVLGPMLRLATDENYEQLLALLYQNRFVLNGQSVSADEIIGGLRALTDPLRTARFHFTRRWLQRTVGPSADFSSKQFQTNRAMNLPKDYIIITRVLFGSLGIYAQLDAEFGYLDLVRRWLPGFAEPATDLGA